MKKSFYRFWAVSVIGASLMTANAQARGVGTGVAFATPNQALIVNPAALVDASVISAEGIWRFDPASPFVSVVGSAGKIALGADFRRAFGENTFQGGLAFDLDMIDIGATIRSHDGDSLDADTAVNINLQSLRLSAVARGWRSGLDRLDLGVGIALPAAFFTFDFKKPFPLNDSNKLFYLDIGVVVDVSLLSLGVGFDMAHSQSAGWSDANIHASGSYQLLPQLHVELFYRPLVREWASSKWAAGARYTF